MNHLRTTLPVLALAAVALAGCAGTATQSSEKGKVTDNAEYEYVTPLGSNIPVKVRKGQSATSATSPSATMSGDAAQSMMRSAPGQAMPSN